MSKFDDREDRIEFNGTELVNTYKVGTCWHCGEPTQWMDTGFMAFLCSEKCTETKWNEYFQAITTPGDTEIK